MGSDSERFVDRRDAGRRPASALNEFASQRPIVLVGPRRGVPASIESAIVGGDPPKMTPVEAATALAPTREALAAETARRLGEQMRLRRREPGERPAPPFKGRTLALVDNGIAAADTAKIAAGALVRDGATRVLIAAPDELACRLPPSSFRAVSLAGRGFDQTSDEDVVQLRSAAWPSAPVVSSTSHLPQSK